MNLFVYGTLMNSDLVQALTGRAFPAEDAVLKDFRKVECSGRYPFIEPEVGAEVSGRLLRGLDSQALARLDRYEAEGELYLRRPVSVVVHGGEQPCQTYVGIPAAVLALPREEGDPLLAARAPR